MAKEKETVAIVGAGLVGTLLAIYLKRRGYAVSIFERRADMRKQDVGGGRSINLALSNRGLKALHEVGLADAIRKTAIPMHGRMVHTLDGQVNFQPYGKEGQFINSISRSGLNMVLMDEAERLGVDLTFSSKIDSIDIQQTKIIYSNSSIQPPTSNFKPPTSNFQLPASSFQPPASSFQPPASSFQPPASSIQPQASNFDYIIGADGAYSAVRNAFQVSDRFDYSQTYIDHGYKELTIPADANGNFQLEKNALHIWPRESFMLIALPNPDGSFTCTLFFPFEGPLSFASIKTQADARAFFQKYFADAMALMPTFDEDFQNNPTASLVTIRTFPWTKNNALLIGDAAHGIVPFYGQGMNAGFEDCRIFNELLTAHHDDWPTVLPHFQTLRKPDADAIAQLALDNFIEMRDLVDDTKFILRKKIEAKLHQLYPDRWIPLYSMVTFHENMRYSEALATGKRQKEIMDTVLAMPNIETTWPELDFEKLVGALT